MIKAKKLQVDQLLVIVSDVRICVISEIASGISNIPLIILQKMQDASCLTADAMMFVDCFLCLAFFSLDTMVLHHNSSSSLYSLSHSIPLPLFSFPIHHYSLVRHNGLLALSTGFFWLFAPGPN